MSGYFFRPGGRLLWFFPGSFGAEEFLFPEFLSMVMLGLFFGSGTGGFEVVFEAGIALLELIDSAARAEGVEVSAAAGVGWTADEAAFAAGGGAPTDGSKGEAALPAG